MNHSVEAQIGIFAIGTLLATDDLVAKELESLALRVKGRQLGWVTAEGNLKDAYNAMLWTRVGDRVVWIIKQGDGRRVDGFRELIQEVDWFSYLYAHSKIRVDVSGKINWLKDTRFAGQLVMDAIRDQAKQAQQNRSEYDSHDPDVRIAVRFGRGLVDIGIHLNKTPLNQRGYRTEGGIAPLRETVAQVMLSRLKIAAQKTITIVDPFCGSGTILIESVMRINQIAPQRYRSVDALCKWTGLEHISWTDLISEARTNEVKIDLSCVGFDINPDAIEGCQRNIKRAGLDGLIHVETRALSQFDLASYQSYETGWIITNPPYGMRLGGLSEVESVYQALGGLAKQLPGWSLGVINSDPELAKAVRLRPDKRWDMQAGGMRLTISKYLIQSQSDSNEFGRKFSAAPDEIVPLLNRIKKNLKSRMKLINQYGLDCYRLYDADLPEFNVIIDRYSTYLHIQEYRPPKTVDPEKARHRRQLIKQWVPKYLELPVKNVIYKERYRQTGNTQYRKYAEPLIMDAHENGMVFEINLTSYTDVGLFMDHRPLRRRLMAESKGKKILNLFCYTGALSVASALGEARQIDSVDFSKTYLAWAQRNFFKNKLDSKNYRFVRENILEWIEHEPNFLYDIILLDPPTFSNTKSSDKALDIQRDHVDLIAHCRQHLKQDGIIYFSSNCRGFKLDQRINDHYNVTDLTPDSLDLDFERSKSHVLFRICPIDALIVGKPTKQKLI